MNYEKKYKEALERARALRNEAIEKEYAVDYIKDYETIFPELCESEDERIRECLNCLTSLDQSIDVIEDMGLTRQQVLAWIEKQKEHFRDFTKKVEQKPAEWSEEDKVHLSWIIECFDSWKYQVPEFADHYQSAIDWLKSLRGRPKSSDNWEPSEEEMSMLLAVIDDPNNASAESCNIALISLYNELKKLM